MLPHHDARAAKLAAVLGPNAVSAPTAVRSDLRLTTFTVDTAMVIKAPKAATAAECKTLEQLPNIGPSLAADLRLIGIEEPRQLRGKDAFVLYQKLCAATGQRQDPCVLDTFMAATDFMAGAPAAPWWKYTPQRKALFGQV